MYEILESRDIRKYEEEIDREASEVRKYRKLTVHANHIFDENQSVIWNREEVVKHNELVKAQYESGMVIVGAHRDALTSAISRYICKELNKPATIENMRIANKIWGLVHVMFDQDDYIELDNVLDIINSYTEMEDV